MYVIFLYDIIVVIIAIRMWKQLKLAQWTSHAKETQIQQLHIFECAARFANAINQSKMWLYYFCAGTTSILVPFLHRFAFFDDSLSHFDLVVEYVLDLYAPLLSPLFIFLLLLLLIFFMILNRYWLYCLSSVCVCVALIPSQQLLPQQERKNSFKRYTTLMCDAKITAPKKLI